MDFEKVHAQCFFFFTENVCIDEYLPCPGAVGSSSLLFVNFILACGIQRTLVCGMNNISYQKNHYSYEVLAVLQDSSPKIIYKINNSVIIYSSLYSSKSV